MEESADYAINNHKISLNYDEQLNSIDVSSSDPIPPLFIQNNNTPKKQKLIIEQIISSIYKNNNKKNIKQKIKNKISICIPYLNLQKHNSTPNQKNIMLINDLIESKETHFIAQFKDYLISDFHEEFLRRYFLFNEIRDILPKFYQYYKNYLNFFCKGTFCDFYLNEIMQEYGECQAEFYYNKNYGHKERMKKKEKKGLDDANHKNEESYESDNISNEGNIKSIFSKSIKYSIDIIQSSYNNTKNKDISNIKPSNYSKDNSISLPDNSSVSYNDIITNQNSLRYIINIIDNKKDFDKKIKNKKSEIIYNKKKPNNNGDSINYILNYNYKRVSNNNIKIRINKKDNQTLSKTNSNLNMKNKVQKRIKSSNTKINNYLKNNFNYKFKGNSSVSNYKKYIDFLTNKQRNKSNDPKIKISQDEFTYSSQKLNKNIKSKNIISSLSPNGIVNHFNFFYSNNYNVPKKEDTKKGTNINPNLNSNNAGKVSSSLFLINNIFNKTTRNSNKYSTIFPLSTSKNNISKNKYNNNKEAKIDFKEKKKVKNKDKNLNLINNKNKFMYFNPNISIKSVKSLSPSSRNPNILNNNNNNINNINSTKPMSYSTVNNCNININNNIILSNNYFNSKNHHQINGNHHQINSLTKKKIDRNIKSKTNYVNKSVTKYANSRNNNSKNDLNRFKTEVNILNLLSQEREKANKNINNFNYINQYKSFRKSNNPEIFSKTKKYNNNTHNRNLSLKNMPVTVKNNLNNNFSMNRTGKNVDEYDLNMTSKAYKHFCLKKNSNVMNQNKIIFDYKRK